MMKWSQMGKEQNSFLRKKGKGVTEKKNYECQPKSQESAPFHTIVISILQKKKKKKQQREKLHSNGHETIDFIEKDCWKSKHNFSRSWQVLCLIIVFRAAAEFILLSLYLCDTSHQLAKNKNKKTIKTTLHHARQFLECENINIAKLLERLFISCLFSVFN